MVTIDLTTPPPPPTSFIDAMARRLEPFGVVTRTPYLLRLELKDERAMQLTVFPDGRLIVAGTNDLERARSVYARYIGS